MFPRSFIWLAALLLACGKTTTDPDDATGPDDASESTGGGKGSVNSGGAAATSGGASSGGEAVAGGSGGAESGGGMGGQPGDACTRVKSGVEEIQLRTQADVEALRGVHAVEASLFIGGSVTDLSPLGCLEHIEGDFGVYEAELLTGLDGMEQLRTIDGSLYVGHFCDSGSFDTCKGSPVLTSISALKHLKSVSSIYIEPKCYGEGSNDDCVMNPALEEIRFDDLTELDQLVVRHNPSMVELRFDALRSATKISIQKGDGLENLTFPELTELEHLELDALPMLKTFGEFPALLQLVQLTLARTGITDLRGVVATEIPRLALSSNDELITLAGLESVKNVETLLVMRNARLQSFQGLNSLETISDHFEATLNPALTSLDGLESLTHAGGVFIQSNYALTDLRGLDSLQSVDGNLTFWTNTLLAHCEADRLRDSIGEENLGSYQVSGGDETAVCDP